MQRFVCDHRSIWICRLVGSTTGHLLRIVVSERLRNIIDCIAIESESLNYSIENQFQFKFFICIRERMVSSCAHIDMACQRVLSTMLNASHASPRNKSLDTWCYAPKVGGSYIQFKNKPNFPQSPRVSSETPTSFLPTSSLHKAKVQPTG